MSDYEVQELVGRGDGTSVSKVWDRRFERVAALKVFDASIAERDPTRFERNCSTSGPLTGHPNVARLWTSGTSEGDPYILLEFASDGSLADRLARGPLDLSVARAVVEGVGAALSAAHEVGVVHGNLKPQNVLFDGDRVIVTDFLGGTARGEDLSVSTQQHTAPEVLAGELPTPTSDVYSFASLVAAAGIPDAAAILRPVLDAPNPGDRPALDDLVARLLDHVTSLQGGAEPSASGSRGEPLAVGAQVRGHPSATGDDDATRINPVLAAPAEAAVATGVAAETGRPRRRRVLFAAAGLVLALSIGAAVLVAATRGEDGSPASANSDANAGVGRIIFAEKYGGSMTDVSCDGIEADACEALENAGLIVKFDCSRGPCTASSTFFDPQVVDWTGADRFEVSGPMTDHLLCDGAPTEFTLALTIADDYLDGADRHPLALVGTHRRSSTGECAKQLHWGRVELRLRA